MVRQKEKFLRHHSDTKLQNKISRREITVIAKKEPVHATSTVSKTQISRTALTRTASTLNDPARVVQTLPGVASQSDASLLVSHQCDRDSGYCHTYPHVD
ncbi:MAG TPA: hypothetical protein DCO75_11770 [Fibrobacteres bacterium]|jgi:hypothetical protein|nr:hypothetical protein [Fibrobacterota bacterium]